MGRRTEHSATNQKPGHKLRLQLSFTWLQSDRQRSGVRPTSRSFTVYCDSDLQHIGDIIEAMKLPAFISALTIGAITCAATTVPVYIQPVTIPETAPALLAEIVYDAPEEPLASLAAVQPEVSSYEPPEIPEKARLVRVGVYDSKAKRWESSTTVVSVDNFSKGYSPHFVLSLDASGKDILGVSCRGVRVDAGYTRDFGPQAALRIGGQGKQPDLNKPVVLSPEGKQVVPEEKTLLQKYTFHSVDLTMDTNALQILVGVCDRHVLDDIRWWGSEIIDSQVLTHPSPISLSLCLERLRQAFGRVSMSVS